MPPATTPFKVSDVLSSLKTKYNIPDEEIPWDQVRTRDEDGLRQDEFSRRMAGVQQKETEAQRVQREYEDKLTQLTPYEQYLASVEAIIGPREQWSIDQLQAVRGGQSSGINPQQLAAYVQQQVSTAIQGERTHFQEQLDATRSSIGSVAVFIPKAMRMWEKEFKVDFPEDDFAKFMQEGDGRGLPLDAGLKLFAQPQFDARQKQTFEDQIKAAEDRGFQRGQSLGNSLEPDAVHGFNSQTFFAAEPVPGQQELTTEQKAAKLGAAMRAAGDGYPRPSGGAVAGSNTQP